MKNWIFYKDQTPVNMGSICFVDRTGNISITFYGDGGNPVTKWIFDSEVGRDLMYKALKDQMTEIKLENRDVLEKELKS